VAYDSIVCVKQVPDTANITAEAMKEDGTVNRAALPTIFNPEDLHALETALEVRDEYGGTVTVVTMGPPKAADVLRDSLFRGADRAILFHAMLSAAGFQPEFVLASSLPPIAGITNITATFPLPEDFQSPLVRVAVDGRTFYLNDTDQYARLGSTPHDGRLGLVLPGSSCEIIKAAPDCQDKTETVYTLSVADNGQSQMGIAWH